MTATTYKHYEGDWKPKAFRGKIFYGVDFSNRSLVGADFTGATCKDCDFSGSDLSLAVFKGADLYRSRFDRAVLYSTDFSNSNLTRATFKHSYMYGWLLNGATANVSYTDLLSFDLEARRRTVTYCDPSENVTQYAFGSVWNGSGDVNSYQVGNARFQFSELEAREAHLLRSQIYTLNKRLYRENHNGEAALHCLYLERYHLTRSQHRANVLLNQESQPDAFGSAVRTVIGYLAEWTAGYGLRPWRIIRTMLIGYLVFLAIAASLVGLGQGQIVRTTPSCSQGVCATSATEVSNRFENIDDWALFGLSSAATPDQAPFVSSGGLTFFALGYFAFNLALLAVLFSSLFLRLLHE
jgi:hypothetical protein